MKTAIPLVLCLVQVAARFAQAQDLPQYVPAPPQAPVGEVTEQTDESGNVIRSWQNEWGYEVTDYGNGFKYFKRPQNLLEDRGPDKERATALLEEGYIFFDRTTSDYIRKLGDGCTFEVSYRLSTKKVSQRTFTLGCLVDPTIDASVRPASRGSLRYSYDVRNGGLAKQRIMKVLMDLPERGILYDKTTSRGWKGMGDEESPFPDAQVAAAPIRIGWFPEPVPGADMMIPAGGQVEDLSFKSAYLPGLTTATFLASVEVPADAQRLEENVPSPLSQAFSKLNDSAKVRRTTIGPQIAPPGTQEDRQAALDRIRNDVDLAVSAGFVPSAGRQALVDLLTLDARDATALQAASAKLAGLDDLDPEYRRALSLVLSGLAPS